MKGFFIALLLIFFSFISSVQGKISDNPQGTVIVTYQTNSEGERLDFIRFWLINSNNERILYPQKDQAVSSHCSMNERTVVISSLPAGRYTVEFLVPNQDQRFEEISPRKIVLEADQIIKIDQVIPTRSVLPAYLKETFELAQLTRKLPYPLSPSRPLHHPRPHPFFRPWPAPSPLQARPIGSATFSLKSNKPAGWRLVLRGQNIYSGVGSISNLYLPPGRNYILLTEPIPGYTVLTAPRNPFDLFPNQIMTMEVFYQLQTPPPLVNPIPIPQSRETPPSLSKGRLRVLTDSSQALFTLKTEAETIIGQGQGYHYLFEDLTPGYYLLDFSNADQTLVPSSLREQIEIVPNQTKEIRMLYQKVERPSPFPSQPLPPVNQIPPATQGTVAPLVQEQVLEVPAGIANTRQLFLPLFYIGTYEVTNAQYADWLNQALQEKKVNWDPSRPGHLLNNESKLLCKTVEGSSLAHLITQGHPPDRVMPIPGKENHPVIEVTWQGAATYCQDKGGRLPTEAEWEKAAGMSISKEGKTELFKYGFGRDEIDRTWANYRDRPDSRDRQQVLTTPVGFYNGENTLPLRAKDQRSVQTHNAKSPLGAYDMSGNVWEWVADHPSNSSGHHVVKGGCYNSPAEEVQVSARRTLPTDYSDIYTGFRIAK